MTEIEKFQEEGEDLFAGWDFETKSTQAGFGKTFRKYLGREFSEIKLLIAIENVRSTRITYKFIKENTKILTDNFAPVDYYISKLL